MSTHKSELSDFDVELIRETDKAWVFDFGGKTGEIVVPKSVGDFDERTNTVTLPAWFIEDRNLG